MADDDRRAEIEAVAAAIREHFPRGELSYDGWLRRSRRMAEAALDRVRDARGDDEAARPKLTVEIGCSVDRFSSRMCERGTKGCVTVHSSARSPQGEDHETARPEQPPPDSLGGQPPAEPETP